MFTENPYLGHHNPIIHWDNNSTVHNDVPAAVEINGNLTYLGDDFSPNFGISGEFPTDEDKQLLAPEHKLVLAHFMCGRVPHETARRVERFAVANGSDATGSEIVADTYAKFQVETGAAGMGLKARERLVARTKLSGLSTSELTTLKLPEDWQQPFRDLVFSLAAKEDMFDLKALLRIGNIRGHLGEAVRRVSRELNMGHLHSGGSTLIALAANLLPPSDEEISARIRSPLTEGERAFFEAAPPKGGEPLLPPPLASLARSVRRPTRGHLPPSHRVSIPSLSPTEQALQSKVNSVPAPNPKAVAAGQEDARSFIVKPFAVIDGFANDTLWLRVDGQPKGARRASFLLGSIGLLGIQGGEVEVMTAQKAAMQLGINELSTFCSRAIGLTTGETKKLTGIRPENQANYLALAQSKIGSQVADVELRDEMRGHYNLPVAMRAAFESPPLFRTIKRPNFDNLENEYALLTEFGPNLMLGGARRSFAYRAITQRQENGYAKKDTFEAAINADMAHLRSTFRLSTLGLTFLYLATRDFDTRFAQQIMALWPQEEKERN